MYSPDTDKMERIALVNLKEWHPAWSSDRGNATITLDVGDGMRTANVRRLHAQMCAAAMGLELGDADGNISRAGEAVDL
ncbi:uncharacterized protein N7482_005597 [Penicillium canariense]|uniref:Beta-glucuronidase C-terminal domain-containing protein n=1 Tax=Penicillium canariense TaxID=189055 RepID=A0A9W9I477_9EURO|nr:uncharacterized protein N7482_005597 [Penicillium canariense]KAJ5166816.1 hypothetical protein N7482_005597 [Penicillium canariense]